MSIRSMHALLLPLLIVVAALATGCGLSHDMSSMDDPAGGMTSMHSAEAMGTGRSADVMFSQQMIPHHQQAVAMSELALDPARGASPAVQSLARGIKAGQAQEITLMAGWLQQWDASPAGEADHEMEGGMGLLSKQQLDALSKANGEAFDALWLAGMIGHHEGALLMASHIRGATKNAAVSGLADAITTSQTRELAEMRAMLAG